MGPIRARLTAAWLSSALLVLMAAPTLAQEVSPDPSGSRPSATPEPSTSVPPGTESQRRDLYVTMPYYLGGFEPEIVMVRGQEHFDAPGADDATRGRLAAFLDQVGADVDDLVSGYALVSQEGFFSFVVGIRVEGARPGTLRPAYLPIVLGNLVEPTVSEGIVGGKEVMIITSVGDTDEPVDLFLYDEGDTLWMVQGPDDVVEVTLDQLPDPLDEIETN